MPRKHRTPKPRRTQVVSTVAIELFKLWQAAEDETKRTALEDQLHTALGLLPWQGPPVIHPDEPCLHPYSTAAAEWWPHGQAMYLLLSQAAARRWRRLSTAC